MQRIIHITDEFDKLISILNTKTLRLGYCQEVFYLGSEQVSRAAHPMVCFCKYDLNALGNFTSTYGRYGVAFNDPWVITNNINPVLYIDRGSMLAEALATLLKSRRNQENSKLPDALRLPIMTIKCFTKNAIGYNSKLKVSDFRFVDENEWRFVPRKKQIGNLWVSQNLNTYLKNPESHNERLTSFPLRFTFQNVARVFVTNQTELDRVRQAGVNPQLIEITPWKA